MRTLIQRRATPARRLAALFLTIVAVALTACGSTATIRDAQDEFSSAARLDNASGLRTGEMPSVQPSTGELGSALAANRAAARSYERARELVASVIATDEVELRQTGLLAHAMTLQAMCEWRLGEWDAAHDTATSALTESSKAAGPRDHALLIAMPGLIRNDQAFAMIQSWHAAGAVTSQQVAAAKKLLVGDDVGAVSYLEKARKEAGGHPVGIYLIQAELAAFKNLNDVMDAAGRFGLPPGDLGAWIGRIQALIDDLKSRSPPGTATDAMVKLWTDAFGL